MKWVLWPAIVLCAAWLYVPGLSGGFRLDDTINLAGLSRVQSDALLDSTLSYVLQGFAGPSGRPLSLLSFALQHQDWPGNPRTFLNVNLLIHLVNGTLLLLLAWIAAGRVVCDAQTRLWGAIGTAALWLCWPIQSSTVLYVVQRMALLAAGSMIVGMLLYLMARDALDSGRRRFANTLFALSWLVGLPIGILCKETAIVFPLLVMTLDLLRPRTGPTGSRPLGWTLMLLAPLASFAVYLAIDPAPLSGYAVRDFGMYERVLTQSRVLWMYVVQILAPSHGAFQFSYDDLTVSRSLMQPPSTLLAVMAWLMTLVLAIGFRRRYPVIAFSALFFLANHALESSILPLEMAFEHRNYLASFGLAFGAAFVFIKSVQLSSGPIFRRALVISAAMYIAWVSWVAYDIHRLWGDELAMAMFRYDQQPESLRAVTGLSEALVHAERWHEAAVVLRRAETDFPEDPVFPVLAAELGCADASLKPASLLRSVERMSTATTNNLSAFAAVDRLASAVESGNCPAYSAADLLELVHAANRNPAMNRFRPDLLLITGRLHAALGHMDAARGCLQASIAMRAKPDVIAQAAVWEIGQGNLPEARRYIAMLGPGGPLPWRQRRAMADDREKLQTWLKSIEAQ